MAWLMLVGSAVLEAVWATALSRSNGLTEPLPSVVFLVATILSVVGLGWAMKSIPTGTAYAVWTGIGAVLTVVWAAATGAEPLSWVKGLLLAGIIACVVGLKFSTPARGSLSGTPGRPGAPGPGGPGSGSPTAGPGA